MVVSVVQSYRPKKLEAHHIWEKPRIRYRPEEIEEEPGLEVVLPYLGVVAHEDAAHDESGEEVEDEIDEEEDFHDPIQCFERDPPT